MSLKVLSYQSSKANILKFTVHEAEHPHIGEAATTRVLELFLGHFLANSSDNPQHYWDCLGFSNRRFADGKKDIRAQLVDVFVACQCCTDISVPFTLTDSKHCLL